MANEWMQLMGNPLFAMGSSLLSNSMRHPGVSTNPLATMMPDMTRAMQSNYLMAQMARQEEEYSRQKKEREQQREGLRRFAGDITGSTAIPYQPRDLTSPTAQGAALLEIPGMAGTGVSLMSKGPGKLKQVMGPSGPVYVPESQAIGMQPVIPGQLPLTPEQVRQKKEIAKAGASKTNMYGSGLGGDIAGIGNAIRDGLLTKEQGQNIIQNKVEAATLPQLSEGQKAVDKAFGVDYVDYVTKGGYADSEKGVAQLDAVLTALETGSVNLTGPLIGTMPMGLKSIVAPRAANTQELVEEVVQRNLRLVLGAQFTQKEGERLIARAYNPKLDEATNAQRVGRLLASIKAAMAEKISAAKYYEANGTLKGYQGKRYSVSDFMNMDFGGTSSQSSNEVDWSNM